MFSIKSLNHIIDIELKGFRYPLFEKWQATLQINGFGLWIYLFCQVRGKWQKVLHRVWNHQYIGIPYLYYIYICPVRTPQFSRNHWHLRENKLYPSSCRSYFYQRQKRSQFDLTFRDNDYVLSIIIQTLWIEYH
jgi:hypothetical protein